jgi:hypothetical protein
MPRAGRKHGIRKQYMNFSDWQRGEAYYMDFRCMANGQLPLNTAVPADDSLKLAPMNLGLLLTSGYVGAPQVFYCPSSNGAGEDVNAHWDYTEYFGEKFMRQYYGDPHDEIRHWKVAGALQPRTLTHGKWAKWFAPYQKKSSANDSAGLSASVFSHYAYRNAPVINPEFPKNTTQTDMEFNVAYTRPRITSEFNCPPFKTKKLLGNRVIASDSFAKGFGYASNASDPSDLMPQPGYGMYAHRDGYNLLLGDGSARWYGDPQQRLIFWGNPVNSYKQSGLWTTSHYAYRTGATNGTYVYAGAREHGLPLVWHTLDVFAGIDVDAPLD